MASTQGIRAGRAFVELFADDSKLVRGLRAAEKKLKAFGESVRDMGLKMMAVGSAILTPLVAAAKLFASYGDSVAKMARRTGISVEALSELQYAAGQSGVEVSDLETSLRKMAKTVYEAQTGSKSAAEALAELGLTAEDLAKLSPEEQFKLLADRISQIDDPTRKAALAMEIFGKSGTMLLPMFASGAKGIDALMAEARRLGLTMSTEDALAAEEFGDAMDRLWQVIKMGVFHIGAALAPTLKFAAEQMMNMVMVANGWIKENQGLIVTVLKVAAAVLAMGVVLTVLGTAISGLGTLLGGLVTIITTVGTVLTALAGVIAFLVTPIGMVLTAIAALGAYLIYATDTGAKALAWLGDRFGSLKDDALSAYQGIADAMVAGDMALAVKILWLTIQMEWTRGINFLEKAWLNFRNFFISAGYDAWHGLLALAETVWHGLEVGWIETTAFFARLWNGFTGFFAESWETIKAGAQKAWNWIKSLFDDSIDLQAENKLVDDQKQAAISKLENDQQQEAARREAQRQAERDREAATHEGTLGIIGQENIDKHNQQDSAYSDEMAKNQAELDKAKQDWQAALDAARNKRQAKESEPAPPGMETPDDIIAKARDALAGLGDIGDMVQQEGAKIGVRGTFNAAAIQGLAAGDAADRTAKASEETAKNTKRLVQAATAGGLTFG